MMDISCINRWCNSGNKIVCLSSEMNFPKSSACELRKFTCPGGTPCHGQKMYASSHCADTVCSDVNTIYYCCNSTRQYMLSACGASTVDPHPRFDEACIAPSVILLHEFVHWCTNCNNNKLDDNQHQVPFNKLAQCISRAVGCTI